MKEILEMMYALRTRMQRDKGLISITLHLNGTMLFVFDKTKKTTSELFNDINRLKSGVLTHIVENEDDNTYHLRVETGDKDWDVNGLSHVILNNVCGIITLVFDAFEVSKRDIENYLKNNVDKYDIEFDAAMACGKVTIYKDSSYEKI